MQADIFYHNKKLCIPPLMDLMDELWISDGTLGGDSLLLDINPTGDSLPGKEIGFTNVNTTNGELVFFDADNGQHGRELWVTDGTAEGTYMVKNSNAGDAISSTTSVAIWNQGLVFTTVNGNQLMYSNGEINSTQSVFEVELFNATQSSNLVNQTSTWNSFGAVSLHSDEFGLWFNADDQSIGFEPRLLTNSGDLFTFDIILAVIHFLRILRVLNKVYCNCRSSKWRKTNSPSIKSGSYLYSNKSSNGRSTVPVTDVAFGWV